MKSMTLRLPDDLESVLSNWAADEGRSKHNLILRVLEGAAATWYGAQLGERAEVPPPPATGIQPADPPRKDPQPRAPSNFVSDPPVRRLERKPYPFGGDPKVKR